VPELESLKRQIETIKNLLANHARVVAYIDEHAPEDSKPKLLAMMNRNPSPAELNEVLATLERMLPPF
jgi:predicted TIM-barrel fold metal-dependent hydrolase